MAVVITVAQRKGGAGKTNLAAHLAAAMAVDQRVAALDIDPQKTLARWFGLRAGNAGKSAAITFSEVSGWRLAVELDRLRRTHDVVLIDSPPQIDTDARVAIRAADLVLVPVQPSPPDVWAAGATFRLAEAERRASRIVLNRVPVSGRLRTAAEAEIAASGMPRLRAALGNRTGFALAFAAGLGITEASPRSSAAAELREVMSEIRELT